MSSAFISFSTEDQHLAEGLRNATSMAGIETFLAPISIDPGSRWAEVIFERLERSKWIFFIASENSINSPAVQQELGASLIQKKTIIPLLVDITPKELPGWVGKHQAIDLRSSPEKLHAAIAKIANEIQEDKFWAGLIFGAFVVGPIVLLAKSS